MGAAAAALLLFDMNAIVGVAAAVAVGAAAIVAVGGGTVVTTGIVDTTACP